MTIVNGFEAQELHPRCGMDARSAFEFAKICNGKVILLQSAKLHLGY